MKNITIILLLCLICFSLAACDPGSVSYYKNEELTADVVSVELINYNNPKVKTINTFISTRKIRAFDFDKMEIIEELNIEKLDDFMQDFSELKIWSRWMHPDSPVDLCIRITYSNGDFEVISCNNTEQKIDSFIVRFNSKGKKKKHIGTIEERSDFINIINSYFITQIDEN